MTVDLGFVSWNVKGLNHPVKRNKVLAHLKQLRAVVAFLQETHLHDVDLGRLSNRLPGQFFHSHFRAKARGTAILIDRSIPFEPSNIISDRNGRFIIVSGKLYNKAVTLANVYAPNSDDVLFFNNFLSQLPDLNSHALILGGDFNCVLDTDLDRSSSKPIPLTKFASLIKAFLSDFGLSDPWHFSFFSHVHRTYSRIDYFFIDNSFLPHLRSCEYQGIVI